MAKIALLIGVSEYEPGLNPLPGAVKDVEAMQQVLVRPDIGEFAESDITVLKNPDRQKMEEEIEKLFGSRQKDDLVLLFFSGHGIKDDAGKLYLATRQTRKTSLGELIRSSAVAAGFVHENMERSRSKRQVVILDSCFSGAFAGGLSAKDDGIVNIRDQLGGEGRAVLTSSSSTQYSFEQQESDLSIYTRCLIEGLVTGAADLDEDGVVSIDELHEYSSRKVREIQPTMKPEIYAIREGFKIRLTKVPPGDPKEKYGKEIRRYVSRGDVTFVGRKILDAQKNRWGLSEAEATAIEDEILAAVRQEFREKLRSYEQDFTEAIQKEVLLSDAELDELRQSLKQILGLRNEDTQPIEVQVRARIEAYKQHLQQYEQAFTEAIVKEYPLSEKARRQLQQKQQQWELTAENVTSIESRITTELEAYRKKLQKYEQAFTRATQQKYPLSEEQRNELRKEQQNLGLKSEDIAPIETRITAEVEAYQHKLQEYEQALTQIIQHECPLSDESREELKRYQGVLELSDEDVARIEARVTSQDNAILGSFSEPDTQTQEAQADIETGNKSSQVEPEDIFQVTLSENEQLRQQQETEYQEKLKFYEQEVNQAIEAGNFRDNYYVSDRLRQTQQTLKLSDSEVASIEARLVPQQEAPAISVPLLRKTPKLLIGTGIVIAVALTFILLDKTPQSEQIVEPASTASPTVSSAAQMSAQDFYNRGNDKYDKGDNKGAFEDFNQALKLNPGYADAYIYRGIAKRKLGDKKGAIEDYNQALKFNPDYALAYYNRGNAKDDLGDNKGAIEDYNQALKLKPDYANAYYNRGLTKNNLGDNKGAIADYQKAAELYQDQGKIKDYQDALVQVKKLQ